MTGQKPWRAYGNGRQGEATRRRPEKTPRRTEPYSAGNGSIGSRWDALLCEYVFQVGL